MYYCVAYDISSNRLRLRAAKWCRQAGLERLQRSVFIGETDPERIKELAENLRPMLPHSDQLAVMPLDRGTYLTMLRNSRLPAAETAGKKVVFWAF